VRVLKKKKAKKQARKKPLKKAAKKFVPKHKGRRPSKNNKASKVRKLKMVASSEKFRQQKKKKSWFF
jgi:hypothetical protein